MATPEQFRKHRYDDFDRRVREDPDAVYRHPRGWAYIPVNAFADETDLLKSLGIEADQVQSVDAWWTIGDDACFVSVRTDMASDVAAGFYARNRGHPGGWIDLLAVIDAPRLTRAAFESALEGFAALGFPKDPRFALDVSRTFLAVD
jgi:hypothetical protein